MQAIYTGVGQFVVWAGIVLACFAALGASMLALWWVLVAIKSAATARRHILHWRVICGWAGMPPELRLAIQDAAGEALRKAVEAYEGPSDDGPPTTDHLHRMNLAMQAFAVAIDRARRPDRRQLNQPERSDVAPEPTEPTPHAHAALTRPGANGHAAGSSDKHPPWSN